jgi:hypothetical protein
MKRVFKLVLTAFIICLLPYTLVSAQGKKSEKRIKIVVSDGSDTKIVIDTLMEGDSIKDSIRLNDGKVIFIGHPGDETTIKSSGENEHISVYVSSDGDHSGKKVKEITVISSDSLKTDESVEHGKVYVYNNTSRSKGNAGGHYSSDDNESSVDKSRYVIAKDGLVVTVEGSDETRAKEL